VAAQLGLDFVVLEEGMIDGEGLAILAHRRLFLAQT